MKFSNLFKKKNVIYKPNDVGSFYNKNHDAFIKVYGEVIQAFRTNNLDTILNYQAEQMGLKPEHRVLDAGCGVCGPARYFAKNIGCKIEAVSISEKQVIISNEHIKNEQLEAKITAHQYDYHEVDKLFPKENFDKVYFLESFGHSTDKEKLLKSIWKVLKPGGEVYIKDLFRRVSNNWLVQRKIDAEINKINKAYFYDVTDLNAFVDWVRKIGYVIVFIKTIDIPLADFENLSISNEFQELTGIAKIDNWEKYIFPIDFFEVKLYKPEYNIEKGKHRYFLQNIYQLQMNHINKEEL
ncbi:MAG TPA: methyltransferase domain-containing protein [Chitinophagales bacterium]|nr:methyltransferase domain-containing protein [Chitinophagales bacterium]HQV78759.1 methyltransferase domain-containing protein [Chitinophagales bacterium]HQW79125.1 methyltransferase domain-containing protein [Chitinophagales bacterium]HRB69173.1 methyltransferase domain-containing protein [Chitinophagales bacterium]